NGIGPARDVASRVDAADTCFHMFVHAHALVDCKASLFGKGDPRAYAHRAHDEIGVEFTAILERGTFAINCRDSIFEMEFDAVLFVYRADEVTELRSEHPFKRALLRRDNMHFDIARS